MTALSQPYSERDGSEFQEYDGFSVEFRESSHRYWGIITDGPTRGIGQWEPRREPWTSVTAALGILSKPQLMAWYGKCDSEAVLTLERDGLLSGIDVDEAVYVARRRGMGAEAQRDAGATRGKAIHAALQAYCSEARIPVLSDFEPEHRSYVQALASWLIEASPEPESVEQIVGSPRHGFAGRLDLIFRFGKDMPASKFCAAVRRGCRALGDAKTGANAHLYPESHIQTGGGYPLTFEECGIEPVERTIVLALSDTGHFEMGDCRAEGKHFLAILAAYKAVAAVKAQLRSDKKAQEAMDV